MGYKIWWLDKCRFTCCYRHTAAALVFAYAPTLGFMIYQGNLLSPELRKHYGGCHSYI